MGRPKRIQFAGACYYIVLQGNNRQDIFVSSQDRRQFLAFMRSYKDRCGLKIYAYCLLPNEAHLLLETSKPNLSMAMQGFNTVYTKYFNSQHNTVGHVFQGRYKALLVDKEHYLAEMTRYIHLYPLRAGVKEKPWRYPWSSGPAYFESDAREPLVDSQPVLSRFARVRLKQSVRYLQYVKERIKASSEYVLPVVGGAAIGSEAFLARAESAASGPAAPKPSLAVDARRILSEVAAKHGIEEEKILGRLQWREITSVRRKAIYRIWKETRMGVTELSRFFNRTPSGVSQLIRKMETGVASN